MAVIDIKDATIKLRDGSDPTRKELEIKIGEGNLTYTETRTREYIKDRGLLDAVRDGDEEVMEVAFDLQWLEITASESALATVEDAIKKRGGASDWVTTGDDVCEPYAVDLELQLDPECGDAKDREYVTFPQYRYEGLTHDLRAGTIAVTGKSKRLEPLIEHAHAAELAALFVSANSEYLNIADNAELSATTDLTVSVWFRPNSVGVRQMIASKHDDGAQAAWALSMETDGKLRVNVATLITTAIDTDYYESAAALVIDTWYHIVFQYDGGQVGNAARLRLWINDVEDTTGSYTGTIPATMPAETAALMVGAFDLGPAAFADGRVSTMVMWTRTLTALEKTFMQFGGLGRVYADATVAHKVSMVSWWPLDVKSGQRKDSHSINHLNDNATVTYADGIRVAKDGIQS